TEQRDERAALRFLTKAIRRHGVPEKITIDGSEANAAAVKGYNEEHGTAIITRQVKYLNNIVEIVLTHMTKTRGLAAGMSGKGVADLDLTIGHEDPVNQELYQGPLLGKRGVSEPGLYPLAEGCEGLHDLCEGTLPVDLGFQLLLLGDQAVLLLFACLAPSLILS